jgi:hypothetical protein
MSHHNFSASVKMGVLTYDCTTIGNLECLLAYHERVLRRCQEDAVKYAFLLQSGQLFTPADIMGLYGISDYKISRVELKKCVVEWMIKYTDNAASALFVAKAASETSSHIYNGLKAYLKTLPDAEKKKFDFPIMLKDILSYSCYEGLYDMLRHAKAITHLEDLKNGSKMERKKVFNPHQPFFNETDIGVVTIFCYPPNGPPVSVPKDISVPRAFVPKDIAVPKDILVESVDTKSTVHEQLNNIDAMKLQVDGDMKIPSKTTGTTLKSKTKKAADGTLKGTGKGKDIDTAVDDVNAVGDGMDHRVDGSMKIPSKSTGTSLISMTKKAAVGSSKGMGKVNDIDTAVDDVEAVGNATDYRVDVKLL